MELFDGVLERLVKTIELRSIADVGARMALADISAQLAPVAQAPATVIRRLARNDEIGIAAPVLQESARFCDDDLIELATTKSEKHLLAVEPVGLRDRARIIFSRNCVPKATAHHSCPVVPCFQSLNPLPIG